MVLLTEAHYVLFKNIWNTEINISQGEYMSQM